MLTLVVVPLGCAHEGTVAPTLSAPTESSASRVSAAIASDDEIAAGELIKAYEALSDGDVSAAAERFPDNIAWSVFGADVRSVNGRDGLRALWSARTQGRKTALGRVFISDNDTLISQGARAENSRSTAFVIIASVDDERVVAVREFLPSTTSTNSTAALPETVEIVDEGGDELNRVTAGSLYAAWGRHDWESIDRIVAQEVIYHAMATGVTTRGIATYRDAIESWADGFPDLSVEIRDSWAVGDYIIIERRASGNNSAELDGKPATNKEIEFDALDVYRFDNAMIVEIWEYSDSARYRRQVAAE